MSKNTKMKRKIDKCMCKITCKLLFYKLDPPTKEVQFAYDTFAKILVTDIKNLRSTILRIATIQRRSFHNRVRKTKNINKLQSKQMEHTVYVYQI